MTWILMWVAESWLVFSCLEWVIPADAGNVLLVGLYLRFIP